jgi:polysaccharide export outer membrane protein
MRFLIHLDETIRFAAAAPLTPLRRALALGGLALGLALFAGVAGGCSTASSHSFSDVLPGSADPGTPNYATNMLHEGDMLNITFQYSTNFNALQKITLDGFVNLESVGQIRAAGRTPLELQAEIARAYKPQVKDDVVTVKLISAVDGVYVSGAVFRPGRIPLERPMTVMEAVMEAGGFDANRARLSEVTVLRIEHGKQRAYPVNLKNVLQGKEETPFYLRPFDIVHVPTRTFNF